MVSWFSRLFSMAIIVISTVVMLTASFDAEARRFGGGRSFGRQSTNILKQRQAAPAPKAAPAAASNATRSASSGQAATASRSGLSRFMAPLAGILTGLGIAALLSHLGLSGAFFELLFLLAFVFLAIAAIRFVLRRLGNPGAVAQAANASYKMPASQAGAARVAASRPVARTPEPAAASPGVAAETSVSSPGWYIPADFDVAAFLDNAKSQFVAIQAYSDQADVAQLRQVLTDSLLNELMPEIQAGAGKHTEVLLLNAELLGIETLEDGYLASVRYSGMLREDANADAVHFEEVWNLYKTASSGWLLAGIQQMPSASA